MATTNFASNYCTKSHSESVNENFADIKSFLLEAQKLFIPSKEISGKYSYPWINGFLKRHIYKRRRLFDALLKNGKRPRDVPQYIRYCKLVDKLIEDSYWKYINNLFDNQGSDIDNKKNLFKFVKSQRKDQNGIPPFKHQGNTVTDAKTKAGLMNDYFTSVFTASSGNPIPDKGPSPHSIMSDITVTSNGVHKLLSNLQSKKATGPDLISARLLKTIAEEITPVFVSLFQQSFDTGIFPDECKKANVTPIHKKGPKSNVENYRPISITSIVGKLLEHILASHFMEHLEKNNILTPNSMASVNIDQLLANFFSLVMT